MAELKTKPTDRSVADFLDEATDGQRRQDCQTLVDLMRDVTGAEPKMWGPAIVGFGHYRYRSEATGREGDWFLTGFSPRKQNLTLYLMDGLQRNKALLDQLGKHKTSTGAGGCLYINRLADVDLETLRNLLRQSVGAVRKKSVESPS